jgi:hypothetical protein
MGRRHAAQADFELVGMSSDPTPGDPDQIQNVVQRYGDIGDAAEKALNVLKKDGSIATGRGAAMDALRKKVGDDLPDKLSKTARSYQDAAQAYRAYIPQLEQAQETLDQAVDRAQSVAGQAAQTVPPLATDATDDDKAAATKQQNDIDSAKGQLSAARGLAEQAQSMREAAARTCAEALDHAAGEAIPERNIFQKIADFFADFPFVQILLGALIAIVSVFFPVVGLILGATLFAITQIAAISSGNFKLGDFLVGLVGLIPGGSVLKLAGGAVKAGAGVVAKVVPNLAKTVKGSITGIRASINVSKTVGVGGKFAGAVAKNFGEGAADEAATEVLNGDGLDAGQIAAAGGEGVLSGGSGGKKKPPADGPPGSLTRSGPESVPLPPSPGPGQLPSAQAVPFDFGRINGIPGGGPLVIRHSDEPLFRNDARHPDEIFQSGFDPRNTDFTNIGRASGHSIPSAFVSTSQDPNLRFGTGEGFKFVIHAPGGVDINKSFGDNVEFGGGEKEITFPGGIRPENIKGAFPINNHVVGTDFIPNPNFDPDAPNNAVGGHLDFRPATPPPPPEPVQPPPPPIVMPPGFKGRKRR